MSTEPVAFQRESMWAALSAEAHQLDLLIIGGGATGSAAALEAAARGLRVALVEANDFAFGTSSRSTKLAHGGVRYLRRGEIKLVREALHERGNLRSMAPHLVHEQRFLLPSRRLGSRWFYTLGLKLYDLLSGKMRWKRAHLVSRKHALTLSPNLKRDRLKGGSTYSDGQFNDARLALAFVRTAAQQGARVINHATVTALPVDNGQIQSVSITDHLSDRSLTLHPKLILNCTGPYGDRVRQLADPALPAIMAPSRGAHIVLPAEFLPGDHGLILPETRDGRVLFAIPWQGRVIVGTTDIPVEDPATDPQASEEEIDYILGEAATLLERAPAREDIVATFAGLRPLVGATGTGNTAALSREHAIIAGPDNMLTMAGGKWTTARRMGEDLISRAAEFLGHAKEPAHTERLRLVGGSGGDQAPSDPFGSERADVEALCDATPNGHDRIHPALDLRRGEVHWMIQHEMACTAEDILFRRHRAGFLDAAATREASDTVRQILAESRM